MSFFHIKTKFALTRGFTIVELITSVAIFALMTAFLVSKYGSFNQNTLLTNLAYDVALTIRNAQSYGLNVKSSPIIDPDTGVITQNYSNTFTNAYGVHFDAADSATTDSTHIIFFSDTNNNGKFDDNEKITTYTLHNGSYVSSVCLKMNENSGACVAGTNGNTADIDVMFKRPESTAIFSNANATYLEITLTAQSGATKRIIVRKSGQIAVLQN